MKIYKITSPNTDLVYVGKTIQPLKQRMSKHWSHNKRYLARKTNYCSSLKVMECEDATIELVEETDDTRREAYWIAELNACNVLKMKIDRSDPDAVRAEWCEYGRINREKVIARAREQIQCSNCGRCVRYTSMSRHKRSKVCMNHQSP